jgi:hypothetical protein
VAYNSIKMKTENCIWFLFLAVVLINCRGVRVTSNGKKIPASALPAMADSTFVIGRFDHIKPGTNTRLISVTRIQGPWQDMKTPLLEHYLKLKNLALRECKRLGGNVLVIKDFHNLYTSSHSSSDILVDVYDVSEIDLIDLKNQKSAARLAHSDSLKSKSTVHLQLIGRPIASLFDVFFNNKLQYSTRSSVTSFTFKNNVYTFSWPKPGEFSVKSSGGNSPVISAFSK